MSDRDSNAHCHFSSTDGAFESRLGQYRAIVQRRPMLAMLEPDASQDGGLTQAAVTTMLASENLDGVKFEWLQKQYSLKETEETYH